VRPRNSFRISIILRTRAAFFASVQAIKCVSAEQAIALALVWRGLRKSLKQKEPTRWVPGGPISSGSGGVLVCRPAWDQFARQRPTKVIGSNPLLVTAAEAVGDARNLTSSLAASGSFEPVAIPAENTVARCNSGGRGPT
jgi:hypothetical protein